MLTEKNPFYVPDALRKSPDPILGLSRLHEKDPREGKIDAGIGVYRDPSGETYTPLAILQARNNLEFGKPDYLSPSGEEEFLGDQRFLRGSAKLAFGRYAGELLNRREIAAFGTPGGTGAVALMVDIFKAINSPEARILIGIPTWPNHEQIAASRSVQMLKYPHVRDSRYNFEAHLDAIKNSPSDTLVLFHTGKTHNPTGVNPTTEEEWRVIARAMEGRKAFFDTPYAGFGDGLVPDTEAIRIFLEEEVPLAVAISYAKNGGLYNERPGALLIPVSTQPNALELQRLGNSIARVNYSSPPAQGERLIAEVLSSEELFAQWNNDLAEAAKDLKTRRNILVDILPEFGFVKDQTGLFSMLPLSPQQVEKLQEDHGVFMPKSGRVNIGGITPIDMPRFAQAIKEVIYR